MIRQEGWRGRIVSALLSGAQGGCLPSMEPPNPDAATMLPPARTGNGCSGFDTAQHLWQRGFMKPASLCATPRERRLQGHDPQCLQTVDPQLLPLRSIGGAGDGDVQGKGRDLAA